MGTDGSELPFLKEELRSLGQVAAASIRDPIIFPTTKPNASLRLPLTKKEIVPAYDTRVVRLEELMRRAEICLAELQGKVSLLEDGDEDYVVTTPTLPDDSEDFPWDELRFGYVIGYEGDPAYVTINEGTIFKNIQTPLAISETPVEITEALYVYAECTWLLTSGTIQTSTTVPVHDDDYFRRWLFRFDLVGGVATRTEIGWMGGNMDISAVKQ